MKKDTSDKLVVSGAPLIGEGNIVDSRSFIAVLSKAGIPGTVFYLNSPLVWLGRWFHTRMSMSTKRTMDYALTSETRRSSVMTLPLKSDFTRALKKVHDTYPHAMCFITSQSILAEESAVTLSTIPSIMCSSDVSGKLSRDSRPSEKHQRIIHLVWNREALDLYKNELNLQNVHLTVPVDPKEGFVHMERDALPFQEALEEPDLCFIKLSGSGGDPGLINPAIISLWEKSRARSIVFPGNERTRRRIIKSAGHNIKVNSSLDAAVFYNQTREMISGRQMLLTYPSEQVKHIALLTQHGIFPKVVWLPPRGQHEMINLAWAVKKGFSGTVCIPAAYQSVLRSRLSNLGVSPSEIEFTSPEDLSSEHFKPSPEWQHEKNAAPLQQIIKKIISLH